MTLHQKLTTIGATALKPVETVPTDTSFARLLPNWQNRYQARRENGKSQPVILKAVIAMALTGIVAASLLLSFFLNQDMQKSDQLRVQVANQMSTYDTRTVLDDTFQLIQNLAPVLAEYPAAHSDKTDDIRRDLRREIFQSIEGSTIEGLVLIGPEGNILLETGMVNDDVYGDALPASLELESQQIDQPALLIPATNGQSLRLSWPVGATNRKVLALLNTSVLSNALHSEDQAIIQTDLVDGTGRLLVSSTPVAPKPTGVGVSHIKTAKSEMRSSVILDDGTKVITFGSPITAFRFLTRYGAILATSVGLALLFVGLIVYLIENEWKKRDRRTSVDEDITARVEIAADMMDVGIIDWRISDAKTVHSEGWQRLFAEERPMYQQEIFDWLARVHPDSRPDTGKAYDDLLNGKIFEINHEFQVKKMNGEYITIRERGRARLDAEGKPKRVILVQRPSRDTS